MVAASAIPIGIPGWPEAAASTASIARIRTASANCFDGNMALDEVNNRLRVGTDVGHRHRAGPGGSADSRPPIAPPAASLQKEPGKSTLGNHVSPAGGIDRMPAATLEDIDPPRGGRTGIARQN
jgi:hypothetical protein